MTAKADDATRASNTPTFIEVLLDESGSMQSCSGATISGFNSFVADQRQIAGDCYLTLTKFDTAGLRTPYENLRIDSVPDLSFFPNAGTPLFNVVGERTSQALNRQGVGRTLIVVITDGQNTERHGAYPTAAHVKAVVEKAIEAGISYLYFGAGPGAKEQALNMGFPEHVIEVFDTREMGATMAVASAKTRAFRANA